MARNQMIRMSFATLALIGARPALAAPIPFTGNVEHDFGPVDPSDVQIVTPVYSNPLQVGVAPFIPANGWVSGWAVKDIRTSYDPASDIMYVGINTFKNASGVTAIVGDADGNGDPGGASPKMVAAGGVDTPSLGGHKSVTIAFAPNDPHDSAAPGTPVVVAGVPADKATAGPGRDGFNVATYKNLPLGLESNYGTTLAGNLGSLAFDPSAQHPGFEFTIKNFSKIPGLHPENGFWVALYAGSTDDVIAGESTLRLTRLPALAPQILSPEPATVLSWTLVTGGALLGLRRRGRSDR